jgi:hypothetical protein
MLANICPYKRKSANKDCGRQRRSEPAQPVYARRSAGLPEELQDKCGNLVRRIFQAVMADASQPMDWGCRKQFAE